MLDNLLENKIQFDALTDTPELQSVLAHLTIDEQLSAAERVYADFKDYTDRRELPLNFKTWKIYKNQTNWREKFPERKKRKLFDKFISF